MPRFKCFVRSSALWHREAILFLFAFFNLISAGVIENHRMTASFYDDTSNMTMMTPTTTASECGNAEKMVDECFKDLPPHLMEFLQTTKITVNAAEISSKCTVFKRGMKCFDEYMQRCLTQRKINLLKNNVEGARNFFDKFCNEPEFQKDYLTHRQCFSHIQDDWNRCTLKFRGIVSDELHEERTNVTNKFMDFCCARYAFENCIYNSARYKCYKGSVEFARDTAKMLSDEKHFSNCRQYEDALCEPNKGSPLCRNRLWHLLGSCSLLVLLRIVDGWLQKCCYSFK